MRLSERARHSLIHKTPKLRKRLGPVIGSLPVQLRYGSSYVRERAVLSRSSDPSYAYQVQGQRLRQTLELAELTDYYEVPSTSDPRLAVSRMPVLSRADMQAHQDRLLTVSRDQLDRVTTSGSSGEPAVFFLDRERSSREWAYVESAWAAAGFSLSDWRAVLRGVEIPNADVRPWITEAAFKELRLSPFHLTEANLATYMRLINRRGIHFLHGYPSALVPLAKFVISGDDPQLGTPITGVFPVSEKVSGWQNALLQRAFPNAKIVGTYGLSERVAFAVEAEPGVYEFAPTYGYTELVDDFGSPILESGRRGRLVSTGFASRGMPLVRYDTGDTARLVEAPSCANGGRLRVSEIASKRLVESLYKDDGSPVSMSALNLHSEAYLAIRKFRFVQRKRGEVEVLVVAADSGDSARLDALQSELQAKVGHGLRFSVRPVDSLAQTVNGKERLVEQYLPGSDDC